MVPLEAPQLELRTRHGLPSDHEFDRRLGVLTPDMGMNRAAEYLPPVDQGLVYAVVGNDLWQ